MKKYFFTAGVIGAFLIGYFLGCGDEMLEGADGVQRTVYEVSEANLTGNGGYISIPDLHVGEAGSGGNDMAMVIVYGSGRGGNNEWKMLFSTILSEGRVWVDSGEYESFYYRAVVIH
ncbi:MAG: hypothetical protein PVH29_06435 [Candidatus Zixiibacteriota bacterium]|jgi:hypothetical protein